MRAQKARILADDVHDVGRDDRLVVLAALLFAQAEQIADDGNEEFSLILLVHRAGNRADRPAENTRANCCNSTKYTLATCSLFKLLMVILREKCVATIWTTSLRLSR